MKRRVSNLMSAAFVAFMTLMCVWFGTPHQFDAPADNDADDLPTDDGEPRDVREMTRYVLFVDSLGSPLPPVVVARMMHEAQERDHA